MTHRPLHSALRSLLALGVASSALLGGGCMRMAEDTIDEFFDAFELTGPLEAETTVAPGLDERRVRVGLVPKEALAPVTQPDGQTEDQWVHLRVSTPNEGRVRLADQWTQTEDGERDEDRFGGVASVAPFGMIEGAGSLAIELPEDAPLDEVYTLVVWYDANDNGMLELSQDEDSEFVRVFRSEQDDKEYMLTDISHNVSEEDPSDIWWHGHAVHEADREEDRVDHPVDDQWYGTPWRAEIGAATEPPLS